MLLVCLYNGSTWMAFSQVYANSFLFYFSSFLHVVFWLFLFNFLSNMLKHIKIKFTILLCWLYIIFRIFSVPPFANSVVLLLVASPSFYIFVLKFFCFFSKIKSFVKCWLLVKGLCFRMKYIFLTL